MSDLTLDSIEGIPPERRAELAGLWIRDENELRSAANAVGSRKFRQAWLASPTWGSVARGLQLWNESEAEPERLASGFGLTIPKSSLLTFERHRNLKAPGPSTSPTSPIRLPPEVNLVPMFPPVRDQGQRGTCVAFATVALREHAIGFHESLSEQFLYSACKELDGSPEPGTQLVTAAAALHHDGVCRDSTWPYDPHIIPDNEGHLPVPTQARVDARQFRLRGCKCVERLESYRIREILAGCDGHSGRPVTIGVLVFESSFLSRRAFLTGELTLPFPEEDPIAGHAMCVVGYRDDSTVPGGGYFIVRNSWGSRWATKGRHGSGHALMPYKYIEDYTVQVLIGPAACPSTPTTGELDPYAKWIRTVNAGAPQRERREWLRPEDASPLGALLDGGRDHQVLSSPQRPDEFRADTPDNRRAFPRHWFGWSSQGADRVVEVAIAEAHADVRDRLRLANFERARWLGAIDENLRAAVGRPFPYVEVPWLVRFAPYEWEPKVRAVDPFADLGPELWEVWERRHRPADSKNWPLAIRRVHMETNTLRVYQMKAIDATVDVVVAWLTPIRYRLQAEPSMPVFDLAPSSPDFLEAIREAYLVWRSRCGGKTPSFVFVSLGLSGPLETIPTDLRPSSSGCTRELVWAHTKSGDLLAGLPDRLPDRLSLRDFTDRLLPLTFRDRVSCVKGVVDDIRLEGHAGRITVDMVRSRTRLRELLNTGAEFDGYRRSLVLDAFLHLQEDSPGLYRVEKHHPDDDLTRGGSAVGRVAIVRPEHSTGVKVTVRSIRTRLIRQHSLRLLAMVITGGIALAATALVGHMGLSPWGAFLTSLPFLYVANLLGASLNRRADRSAG